MDEGIEVRLEGVDGRAPEFELDMESRGATEVEVGVDGLARGFEFGVEGRAI